MLHQRILTYLACLPSFRNILTSTHRICADFTKRLFVKQSDLKAHSAPRTEPEARSSPTAELPKGTLHRQGVHIPATMLCPRRISTANLRPPNVTRNQVCVQEFKIKTSSRD